MFEVENPVGVDIDRFYKCQRKQWIDTFVNPLNVRPISVLEGEVIMVYKYPF
jgi:hypothetical protein